MDFKKKRWISLFAGFCIEALAGVIYAWSVFQAPLMEKYGWSVTQVSFTYSLTGISTMLTTILLGSKVHRSMSVRKELILGSLFYCIFMMATAFIHGQLILLYLFFGIFSAAGLAFVYPLLISYAVELFPDHSGFAGGIMTAGYGLGSVLWAPLATKLYTVTGDISAVFFILGGFFLVSILLLSLLIYSPPVGFHQEMLEQWAAHARKTTNSAISLYDVDTPGMLHLPLFYLTFLSLLLILSCGSMIITQASPIMVHTFNTNPVAAASIVSALALANVAGRLFWGAVSDKLSKTAAVVLINLLLAACTLGLLLFSAQKPFTGMLLGVILCYGGLASIVAPLTSELFGDHHVSENYSVMFCIFGFAALIGPPLISSVWDSTHTYTLAYAAAAISSLLSFGVSLFLLRAKRKSV